MKQREAVIAPAPTLGDQLPRPCWEPVTSTATLLGTALQGELFAPFTDWETPRILTPNLPALLLRKTNTEFLECCSRKFI